MFYGFSIIKISLILCLLNSLPIGFFKTGCSYLHPLRKSHRFARIELFKQKSSKSCLNKSAATIDRVDQMEDGKYIPTLLWVNLLLKDVTKCNLGSFYIGTLSMSEDSDIGLPQQQRARFINDSFATGQTWSKIFTNYFYTTRMSTFFDPSVAVLSKVANNISSFWTVVVAQLVEWLLPIPEVRSLNPVIGKNLFVYCQLCIEKMKIKKKRPGMAHLKNNNISSFLKDCVI